MGCVSSKAASRRPERHSSWHFPLSRNFSTSTAGFKSHYYSDGDELEEEEEQQQQQQQESTCHIVSLTSSSYGVLNTITDLHTSHRHVNRLESFEDDSDNEFMFCSASDIKRMVMHQRFNGVEEQHLLIGNNNTNGDQEDIEVINTWELMEGLEDRSRSPSPLCRSPSPLRGFAGGNLTVPKKEISLTALQPNPSGDIDSPVWKKYYHQEDMVKGIPSRLSPLPMSNTSPFNDSPRKQPPRPLLSLESQTSSSASALDPEDSRSVSSVEPLDGLKFLLSSANSPSFYPSPIEKKRGLHSTSLSFDDNDNTDNFHKGLYDGRSPYASPISMHSLNGSSSPLFDPSLMATFEQAIRETTISSTVVDSNKYEWLEPGSDESVPHSSSSDNTWTSSSSENTIVSSEAISDAESAPIRSKKEYKLPASKVMPVNDESPMKPKRHSLESYQLRCPPRGDGKVVLYFTSLRAVRKTYEACCNLKMILNGLGVHVDERDISMHSEFKEELIGLLGDELKGVPHVPRLFIKGRYIGGAEIVKHLHEDGTLQSLMDGIEAYELHTVCNGCGDARFVPCLNCNGSRKILTEEYETSRCLHCNENGLILCPFCTN